MRRSPLVTSRARLLMGLVALLAVQTLLIPSRVWHYLFIAFAFLLVISYAWTFALGRNVVARRRLYQSLVQVGERLSEDFTLANRSFVPAPWLEVRDSSDLPGYSVGVALSLGAQTEHSWKAGGICRQRGQFRLGPWLVRTGDPFGLFEVSGASGPLADLLVYPPVGTAPEVSSRHGDVTGSRSHVRRALHQTVTSAGVRQYLNGDPPRYIHWPSSARLGELMVKDFDLEPSGDVWVVADMSAAAQAGEAEESTEEYAILAATALAARALRRNQAVGLLSYGQERLFLPPAKGQSQYWLVMRGLATLRAVGTWDIGRVLQTERRNIGRAGSVVVLATSASPDLVAGVEVLRRLGLMVNMLVLDAASFGGRGDAGMLARQLIDLGVPHSVIGRGYELVPLSRRDRRRRRAARVGERWGLNG
jgi:uncharacterized protein (DUF58 family)